LCICIILGIQFAKGTGQAMPIPEPLHPQGFGGIHNVEKKYGIWGNNIK